MNTNYPANEPSTGHILVLGATGTTGGEVARQLITAGHRPRLLVRGVSRVKAAEFENNAVIVDGDLQDDSSMTTALSGVEKLYLACSGLSNGVAGRFLERRTIDTARKAGVKHVVKLSTFKADDPSLLLGRWHGDTERHLIDSGMAWTMLRPATFNTNALSMWADSIKSQGVFSQPTGHGRWASIDPADIAAVAVRALTSPGHESKIYTLTGPESMDGSGYAAQLASVLGKSVSFMDSAPELLKQAMVDFGFPEDQVNAALQVMGSVKANEWDVISNDVSTVLGRLPVKFDDWTARNAAAFC
ncbi:SDR family oxidoreductase [Allopusillimonas ginsengisoli]|uniref:SDR family oxidoreductase n=1 Tax=Allopusillimonas ginsengisoli TaxID=453575 RepID=UPI0010220812|nr:SDR family oxidoreductase [Allopusillimonas ginsengisoli]TEA69456.1 SDR family oxidoreductase [Allopusillimonas ginsengisoli]